MNDAAVNHRSISDIAAEMKEEFKQLIQTRMEMFKRELQEKLARLKVAAPVAGAAILLLITAYLLITLAIVAVIAAVFAGSPYRWFFGFIIVGVAWGLLGAVAAYFAKRELEIKTLAPTRTMEVLKGDKRWLETEVKHQL
jgi:uncharacterized membrane protein YqjE